MVRTISREELKEKVGRRPVLVEALPKKYYLQSHLPGALNIPHDQVEAIVPDLLPYKNVEIVVYCANSACQNSRIAAKKLAELGYMSVSVYEGGKADWIEAGLPTEGRAAERAA